MSILRQHPVARWFESLGRCRCGRAATGTLRGVRNESLGYYCAKCANKRIKDDEQQLGRRNISSEPPEVEL